MVVPVYILSVTTSWYLPRVGSWVAVTVGLLLIAAGLVSLRVLEIGAALGVAVTGSILAALYTTTLSPTLTQFTEPVRERALGSLAEALAVSEQIGPLGPRLTELARSAFLHAMDSSVMVLAIVIVTASVFIGIWSPGRDGRQSGVVRRLRRLP